ncbi:hypothetical protein [Frateuria defendens]|uniref:hypothetical protein n=1 Tax=Frateuria defendens TaxID=2219559 RepID=UPI0013791515|nr:hypothetical protein [Frateuria defendens]
MTEPRQHARTARRPAPPVGCTRAARAARALCAVRRGHPVSQGIHATHVRGNEGRRRAQRLPWSPKAKAFWHPSAARPPP